MDERPSVLSVPSIYSSRGVLRVCCGKPVGCQMATVNARWLWWCIKLWHIMSLGSVQVDGFFDVAARFCTGDGPIAAFVGVRVQL